MLYKIVLILLTMKDSHKLINSGHYLK